ncbi:hypothetical protein BESB_027940 [Besnoitia besnoiti]|uniref:Transmembrane protein n=1 Tax=Besnoitia besnoiti TaxID=94643 RepID=A0A2A9M086_BESBE|nr:uncharacterized protein BESB_027940 [Besnoitia besnoiti]PFH31359.1 hypothetical protein BESB_027940 [Besnoitia besnoiti]
MWKNPCVIVVSLYARVAVALENGLDFRPDEVAAYLAQKAGFKLSTLVTMQSLSVDPGDAYILPRPPRIEECLSAMQGRPLTRMPKPYDMGIEVSSFEGYRTAQLRIAEAKTGMGIGGEQPEQLLPAASYQKGLDVQSFEEVPAQYQSLLYVIPQALVYIAVVPGATIGLKYAKSPWYIRQGLLALSSYIYMSLGLILFISVLPLPAFIAVVLSLSLALLGALLALRSVQSLLWFERGEKTASFLRGMEKEPYGWLLACQAFCLLSANLLYCLVSGFLPGHLGVAGLFTGNTAVAGFLYFVWIIAVATGVFLLITCDRADARKTQNVVLAFCCSYCIVAGLSFFANVTAIYGGIGNFVALDPVPFFSVANPFSFNAPTLMLLAIMLSLWAVGITLIGGMDDKAETGRSLSTVSLSSFSEASEALTA